MQRAAHTALLAAGLHEQRPETSAQRIRNPEADDDARVVFEDPALAALTEHLGDISPSSHASGRLRRFSVTASRMACMGTMSARVARRSAMTDVLS